MEIKEQIRRIPLGHKSYAMVSEDVCGHEVISIFGPQPGSQKIGYRGSVQFRIGHAKLDKSEGPT
jgi:hypothetical protein